MLLSKRNHARSCLCGCYALLGALTWPNAAYGQSAVGISLYTHHFGTKEYGFPQNNTPGVYLRTSDWVIGYVRNSYDQSSFYAAAVWQYKGIDLSLGAITGYQYRTLTGSSYCPTGWTEYAKRYYSNECRWRVGTTESYLRPFATLSYKIPIEISGVSPRVSLLGKGIHLSIERDI